MKTCPHCGGVLEGKPRSSPDHRRFFALVRAAYDQWPIRHPFQPDDENHLRAWLIAKAGHRNVTTIELPSQPTPQMERAVFAAVKSALQAAKAHAFIVPTEAGLCVVAPKSISWEEMGQREFGLVRDEVTRLIEEAIGAPADRILMEWENRA